MLLTHSHLSRGSDPRLAYVLFPVNLGNPKDYDAAPWDKDLFEKLTIHPSKR